MWTEAARALRTPRDLLRFAVSRFREAGLAFGHGSTGALDEAAYLILHALHLPLDQFEPYLDARLTPTEAVRVLHLLERRVRERLPAAYLTGEAWLGDYRFAVDARCIVPRSHLARLLLPEPADLLPAEPARVLDLCTGSGCLAILAALAWPGAVVDAVDLSAPALEVATRNVSDYGLQARVHLRHGDLLEGLDAAYDLILCNPPYVDDAAMAALPPEYRHEPVMALRGGADGLDLVARLLEQAPARLAPGGLLVVEIGDRRAALEARCPAHAFLWPDAGEGTDQFFAIDRGALEAAAGRLRRQRR